MLKIKIKTTKKENLLKKYADNIRNIQKTFDRKMRTVLPNMIIKDILAGVSPVRSHRFKTYAPSYKKMIKKYYSKQYGKSISPVNMQLSGKMLKSIRFVKGGRLLDLATISFEDKKAYWHTVAGINRKDGNVKRKLLPVESGEQFNAEITDAIRQAIINAISVEGR